MAGHVNLEESFLKLIDDSKEQREAFLEAMGHIRAFLAGKPDAFTEAARAFNRLEQVETKAREQGSP